MNERTNQEAVVSESTEISENASVNMICFQNVSFTYPGMKTKALDRISVKIPLKSSISIVGRNGSDKINGLAGEKTCVFITHRLAGVRFSSRILYFEKGRIAEQGSCQELLDRKGKFYEFYQIQAQMY